MILESQVFLTNKSEVVGSVTNRSIFKWKFARSAPPPVLSPFMSHVIYVHKVYAVQFLLEYRIALARLTSVDVIFILLAFTMVVITAEIHHLADGTMNEP